MKSKIKIVIPKALEDFSLADRLEVMQLLNTRMTLPQTFEPEGGDDSDIWTLNTDPILALLEESFYQALQKPQYTNLQRLISYLGVQEAKNVEKSLSVSDLIDLGRKERMRFIDLVTKAKGVTKSALNRIDAILTQDLPNYAKLGESFMLRAMLLARLPKAQREVLQATGALLDRLPEQISKVDHANIVLTKKEQERLASQGIQTTVLPLTPKEVQAIEVASDRAGDKLQEVEKRTRDRVKELVQKAVQERWTPEQLRQALYDELGHLNRDWRRVAITELAMAHNDAFLHTVGQGEKVYVSPIGGACKYCQALLEGKTFTVVHEEPKTVDHKTEMNVVWPGKTNQGRKVAAWIPCIPLHPNCRHRYQHISKFYKVDNGKPKLKTAIELIQEERARRGLPPDPHIAERLAKFKQELQERED